MKKTYCLLILTFFAASSVFAESWYTTGLNSDWNDAESWSADPALVEQLGIPSAGDDVIIRHPLTLTLEETYQHTGNITIEDEGILEVFTLEANTEFILAGPSFLNEGILMTNLPVIVRDQNQLSAATFTHAEGSQMLLGSSLTLIGKVDVNFQNGNCGAVLVKGGLHVSAVNIRILGKGSWIVEEGYTVYDKAGTIISAPAERDAALAATMETGLSLYSDINMCALEQRGLAGTLQPNTDPQVEAEDKSDLISVFPNPSSTGNQLTIDAAGFEADEPVVVEIRTMMGQQIMSHSCICTTEGSIQMTSEWNIEPGQYIMIVRGSQHLATQRIVRQ